jgi:hypothetical protein
VTEVWSLLSRSSFGLECTAEFYMGVTEVGLLMFWAAPDGPAYLVELPRTRASAAATNCAGTCRLEEHDLTHRHS